MMRPPHRKYIAAEMTVAAAISAVLSIVFLLLIFGAPATVPVAGRGGLVMDAVPQSAVIALMSSLVPTLLTRRRMRAGAIAPMGAEGAANRRLRHPLLRALAAAVVATVVGAGLQALLLPLGPAAWPFAAALVYKPVYGALLGALVARWAVSLALTDPVTPAAA